MSRRLGISFLKSLDQSKVVGADDLLKGHKEPVQKVKGTARSKNPVQKINLGLIIYGITQEEDLQLETEYRYNKPKRHRFDWAIPQLKIAIEYEGLQSAKSGHTTLTGYTEDCTKYNRAVLMGWVLLRYTAKNYKEAADDLREAIKIRDEES